MRERDRFERQPGLVLGSKIRNRPPEESPGEFLGRLWALFGAPNQVTGEGFDYSLRDRETGLAFSAYSGASGPAYGGRPEDHAALGPVLDAFDSLIDSTPAADIGGKAFERRVPADAGRLRRALHEAEADLGEPSRDPWSYLSSLTALDGAWRESPEDARAALEACSKTLAAQLLRATFETGEQLTVDAADDWIRVPFVDAGLSQLQELADSPLLDSAEVKRIVDKLNARLTSSS